LASHVAQTGVTTSFPRPSTTECAGATQTLPRCQDIVALVVDLAYAKGIGNTIKAWPFPTESNSPRHSLASVEGRQSYDQNCNIVDSHCCRPYLGLESCLRVARCAGYGKAVTRILIVYLPL
jgi:hypothetical protein